MNKNIAIILPYKEIFSHDYAGAASIWVKDYNALSKLSSKTIIYGNIDNKLKPISKNFKNISLKKNFFSKNKEYIEKSIRPRRMESSKERLGFKTYEMG